MGIITKKSFTLIELVVSVGIIGLILPSIFNIFFTIIRQQLVLVAYQEVKRQGDSAQNNIKNILQNRAAYITDSTYIAADVCPYLPNPTPTYSPDLYVRDRNGNVMHYYQAIVSGVDTIASASGNVAKVYNLTSTDVKIAGLEFSCYSINSFTPAIISTRFIVQKSTVFKEISLPYFFSVKLRSY